MTRRPFDREIRRAAGAQAFWIYFLIGALSASYGWMFGNAAGR